jgi:hypothetical protein
VFVLANQQACSELFDRPERKGMSFDEEVRLVQGRLASEGRLDRHAGSFLVHAGMMEALERWSEAQDVPFVDVIAATDERRDLLLTYVHPNAEGNRLIAQAFVDAILRQL